MDLGRWDACLNPTWLAVALRIAWSHFLEPFVSAECMSRAHTYGGWWLNWEGGGSCLNHFLSFKIIFVCARPGWGGWDGGSTYATVCLWKLEDKFHQMVLSFHYVDSGDPAQVVRLGSKCLNLLTHLPNSYTLFCVKVCHEAWSFSLRLD